MNKKITLVIFLGILASSIIAMPIGFKLKKNGTFTIEGLPAEVKIFFNKGKRSTQNNIKVSSGYPVMSGDIHEVKGEWIIPGIKKGFMVEEKVSKISSDTITYSMSMRHKSGIKAQEIMLAINLPIFQFSGKKIWVDDKEIILPQKRGKLPKLGKVSKIMIPYKGKNIIFTGKLIARITDMSRFQKPVYRLSLYFTPHRGSVKEATLTMNISIKVGTRALSLDSANKGKLSRKESKKFLHKIGLKSPKGKSNIGGVEFTPSTVLKVGMESTATLAVKNSGDAKCLFLLHNADSSANNPQLTLYYTDGTKQKITLKREIDFSTKKPLSRIFNGALIASNNQDFQGLYFSMFPLKKNGLSKISFSNDKGNWYVAAVTLGNNKILADNVNSIYYLQENADWAPLEILTRPVMGSILDFSRLLDAPAGKYGFIKINKDGHFFAEKMPDKQIRFWGANIDGDSLILENKEAENLADELAACGYNSIRFHHTEKALVDRSKNDSRILDPAKLDKLDYLFYCLKKRGIYITTDLYCTRRIKADEAKQTKGVLPKGCRKLKHHIRVTKEGRENYKDFSRIFLNHVNPYTGIAWGKDPALYGIVLINEDFPYNVYNHKQLGSIELAGYKKYLQKMNLFTKKNFALRGKLLDAYVNSSYIEMIKDLKSFLHNEIQYKGVITSMNLYEFMAQNEIRDHFDYVDNHAYWDHPNYSFIRKKFPRFHNQTSALKYGLWTPRRQFPARIFGKPYTLTELNYCFPNRFRGSFGPVIGAYGALQDWDGMYRFDWSSLRTQALHEMPLQDFSIAQDSLSQIADRIINLMYLRGDVKTAKSAVAWPYGQSYFDKLKDNERPSKINPPDDFSELGFYCRIGSLREDINIPGVLKIKSKDSFLNELTAPERKALNKPNIDSETKQIIYNSKAGSFRVITPKTESLTLEKGDMDGKVLSVKGADTFQIITASAMDDKPLATSRKIIVFHQSDVSNKYMRFTSKDMCTVEDWGRNEQLIRKAKIRIKLSLGGKDYKVSAIGLNGKPKGNINSKVKNGELVFNADTASFGGTMIYLIDSI